MTKVIQLHGTAPKASPPTELPQAERELFERMVTRYGERRSGALRHTKASIRLDESTIRNFHQHCGKPPWRATTDDFIDWCSHLTKERKLRHSSQRRFQVGLAKFYDYLTQNVGFVNEVQRVFGKPIEHVAPPELRLVHQIDREGEKQRTALSLEQIDLFFATIDKLIEEASTFHSKSLNPLRRDRALFYTMYTQGLRIGETVGLNLDSFTAEPHVPELGKFGVSHVWGKGSNGSGLRYRAVPVTTPHLPPVLAWYLDCVRPEMIQPGFENDQAFFLSERGGRVTADAVRARFKEICSRAGLDDRGFTPHCLRHSAISHNVDRMTPEMSRVLSGHSNQATTQRYTHVTEAYLRERFSNLLRLQIAEARKEESKS